MILTALFFVSGAGIVAITVAKRIEERRKKTNFVLRAIARGNEHAHEYRHGALHAYTVGKERADFWLRKQLPLRSKNWWYKLVSFVEERSNQYLGEMRDAKLFKRSDGLSEFFKNISEIEKGNGELHDEVYSEPQPSLEATLMVTPVESEKKKRIYTRRKKLEVVEME